LKVGREGSLKSIFPRPSRVCWSSWGFFPIHGTLRSSKNGWSD